MSRSRRAISRRYRLQFGRPHWLLALAASVGLTVLAPAQHPPADSLPRRVDAYLEPYLDLATFSGVVLVARHDTIFLNRAYGMANSELRAPNTPETRFHIASLSKTFTAAAVLLLAERGLLGVNDPVRKFVPDYPRGSEITIHHLLSHSSGIPDVNGLPGYDSLARLPHTPA
jgi:D-alanyl-D-alanine carboxypeptidase